MKLLLTSLLVISAFSSLAQAATPAKVLDKDGMPICQLSADGKEFIKFEWNQDHYQRDVFVEKSARTGFDISSQEAGKIVDLYQARCVGAEREYDKSTAVSSTRVKLAEGQTSVLGYTIDQDTSALLSQVRLGGTVARPTAEKTHSLFLAAHPVTKFTVEYNREITQKYGMGFAAQVYKDYIESQPKNAALKSKVESYMAQSPVGGLKIADRFKGYTFALVRGYAFTLGDNSRYEGMTQDLIDAGLTVKNLGNLPFGSIDENREIIEKEVGDLVAQGQKVILMPASKGGAEALGAISDLAKKNGNLNGVAAVLSLSSMVKGALVVDFAGTPFVWPFAKKQLFKEFNSQGGQLKNTSDLNTMLDMETKKIDSFYDAHPLADAKGPVYVNLVGTPLGSGLVQDAGVLAIQNSVIRPYLQKNCGASDGYIEFPGTEVPESEGMRSYSLAFNSSHAIIDGDYEGHSMSDDASRRIVLTSILASLADILAGSL